MPCLKYLSNNIFSPRYCYVTRAELFILFPIYDVQILYSVEVFDVMSDEDSSVRIVET